MKTLKKNIAILGSTGSIGTQALEVIEANPEYFSAYVLTAGSNVELLIEQCRRFEPEMAVIADESKYALLKEALRDFPVKVFAGADAIAQVAELDVVDIVLTAMVGYSGLKPTIHAVKAGKTIALANKETLVVAGELINDLCQQYNASIIPVDSEHSAIFQCLTGESAVSVEQLILTASGGPFRTLSREELEFVTPQQALKHPNWDMGAKITIDSASMMNKGFEVMEAKWLFGVDASRIQVVVHPQSIIHSMVQFRDGSIKAQLGLPDMKLPIQYAFTYPDRLATNFPRLDFALYPQFTFEQPNPEKFRNLAFAYYALEKAGNMPCILNAANEVVVAAFLKNQIGFLQMSDSIEEVMDACSFILHPTYDDYVSTDKEARRIAAEFIQKK
ncbi:MAG: 1-deoxy-D-xylulose-5-phosphate reductoisomerase [Paludibacter sp.]|nr:1-deoxy-D-xylulose-5-phosphate reductoisomerase [Paludibacter sp.]